MRQAGEQIVILQRQVAESSGAGERSAMRAHALEQERQIMEQDVGEAQRVHKAMQARIIETDDKLKLAQTAIKRLEDGLEASEQNGALL